MEKNIMIKKTLLPVLLAVLTGLMTTAEAQRSLYQDIKAHQVGDIITIILTENITGSSSSDARNSANSDADASGSVSSNFIPLQPAFGSDVNVNYGEDQRNSSSQGQLLKGLMSVQIKDVTESGDLLVEGTRLTEINGERHEMNLIGTVRPMDIDSQNRVNSYRVANADIVYKQHGGRFSGVTKKRGFLTRAVLTGVGVVLGAVIVNESMN